MKPILILTVRANVLPTGASPLAGGRFRRADALYLQQLQARYRSILPIKDLNPSDEKPRPCPINKL